MAQASPQFSKQDDFGDEKQVPSFKGGMMACVQKPEKQVDKLCGKDKFASMFEGKNQLPLILTGLLFVCAIVAAIGASAYYTASSELRVLQTDAARMDSGRNLARVLAAEAVEYSKRNPAIDPLLQSFGAKPAITSPKAAK